VSEIKNASGVTRRVFESDSWHVWGDTVKEKVQTNYFSHNKAVDHIIKWYNKQRMVKEKQKLLAVYDFSDGRKE
jgi:hypothetical protein